MRGVNPIIPCSTGCGEIFAVICQDTARVQFATIDH